MDLNEVEMDFDATSLYPSAIWDLESVYPKIESGFAFKPHMNNIYVEAFNQDSKESAISKLKYYNPLKLVFQHIPAKEEVGNIEVNRMRNGYIVDILTSVDIQEIVQLKGKTIKTYEGVIY